jgi:hypothetical protein
MSLFHILQKIFPRKFLHLSKSVTIHHTQIFHWVALPSLSTPMFTRPPCCCHSLQGIKTYAVLADFNGMVSILSLMKISRCIHMLLRRIQRHGGHLFKYVPFRLETRLRSACSCPCGKVVSEPLSAITTLPSSGETLFGVSIKSYEYYINP